MANEYVTRGTVQLTVKSCGDPRKVRVTPTQDYAVKHREKTWIVLFPSKLPKADASANAVIVPTDEQRFTAEAALDVLLAKAAVQGIEVELGINRKTKAIMSVTLPARR
ncbi:MAG: hypothetical protein ACRD1L_01460 [Terriglobales bacterium]